jgi:hypothetical protein
MGLKPLNIWNSKTLWKIAIAIGVFLILRSCYDDFINDHRKLDQAAREVRQEDIENVNINDAMHFKPAIDVAVTSVTTSGSVGGMFMNQRVSEGGVYVIVKYKYKNLGTEPFPAGSHFHFLLVDGKGTEYKPDVGATVYESSSDNNNEKVLSDLNPGLTVMDTVVFEVAKDQYDPATWSVLVDRAYRVKIKPILVSATGLDAPFVVHRAYKPESFMQQLRDARVPLAVADGAELDEAISFLVWAAADHVRKTDPATIAKWKSNDVSAYGLLKLHEIGQESGDKMTLRKYILLANEQKKQNPELAKQYTTEMK